MAHDYKIISNGKIDRISTASLNAQIDYDFYYSRLRSLATARIKWTGLPNEIDPLYVNEKLLNTNMCYFRDEVLEKEYILPATPSGISDPQGIPTKWVVLGANGYTRTCTAEDSVLIRCSTSTIKGAVMTPQEIIGYYARQLAEIEGAIQVNLKRTKTPWVLSVDKTLKNSIEKFFNNIDDNVPMIAVDKDWNDLVKSVNLTAPLLVPQLYEYKKSVWLEALTQLGVTNSSIEKKERVNTTEVETNNAGTIMMRYTVLAPYLQAVEKINKMFGRNITVEFRGTDYTVDDIGNNEKGERANDDTANN